MPRAALSERGTRSIQRRAMRTFHELVEAHVIVFDHSNRELADELKAEALRILTDAMRKIARRKSDTGTKHHRLKSQRRAKGKRQLAEEEAQRRLTPVPLDLKIFPTQRRRVLRPHPPTDPLF